MIKNAAAVLLLLFGVNIASANFLISNTFTEQMGRCEISFYDETLLADILISGIASYIDADEIEAKQFINSRLDELTQLYGFTSFGLEIDNFQSYTEGADKFVSELNTLIPEFEQELAKLSPSNYRGLFGYGDIKNKLKRSAAEKWNKMFGKGRAKSYQDFLATFNKVKEELDKQITAIQMIMQELARSVVNFRTEIDKEKLKLYRVQRGSDILRQVEEEIERSLNSDGASVDNLVGQQRVNFEDIFLPRIKKRREAINARLKLHKESIDNLETMIEFLEVLRNKSQIIQIKMVATPNTLLLQTASLVDRLTLLEINDLTQKYRQGRLRDQAADLQNQLSSARTTTEKDAVMARLAEVEEKLEELIAKPKEVNTEDLMPDLAGLVEDMYKVMESEVVVREKMNELSRMTTIELDD